MSDTELTVSRALVVRVDLKGLDFNRLVQAIVAEANRACGELLGQAMRAVERWASEREPQRWINQGQQTRAATVALGGGDGSQAYPLHPLCW